MHSIKTLSIFLGLCLMCCSTSPLLSQQLEYDKKFAKAFGDKLPKLTAPSKPVVLTYKANDDSQIKYQLLVESEMDTMGMITPRNDEYIVGMTINKADKNLEMKTVVLEMVSEMNTRGGGIRIDTRNPATEKADTPFIPLKKIWTALINAEAQFELSPEGVVPKFEPPKVLSDTIGSQGGAYGINARDISAPLLSGCLQLPNKSVTVGDSWEMQVVISPLGTSDAAQTGTFLGMGKINNQEYAVFQVEFESSLEDGEGIVSEAEIESSSIVLFDVEAGNMFQQFIISDNDMVMKIGENELQQSATGSSIVKRMDE